MNINMSTNTCIDCAFSARTKHGVIKCIRFPHPINPDDFKTKTRYKDAISIIKNNKFCPHYFERSPDKSMNILESHDFEYEDDIKCFIDSLEIHEWQ